MGTALVVLRGSLKVAVGFIAVGGICRLRGAEQVTQGPSAAAVINSQPLDGHPLGERQLTDRIDAYFARYWQSAGVEPTARAEDAEFLRRAYLDLIGKIPSATEARAFLDDANDAKRSELIGALLKRGAYATHFANTWRAILLSGAADSPETRVLTPRLETWLKLRFSVNAPYDEIARDLLTASLDDNPQRAIVAADGLPNPMAFYQAAERKPELLAASTSRVFWGVQVQCAQCHDHPRAHWTRQNFWSYAAFFVDLNRPARDMARPEAAKTDPIGIKIPETEITVPAMYLDGSSPAFQPLETRRAALARWLTTGENRWFAEATVNRVWEHLLGRGLVDPVDDLESANAADHLELMALLARQFRLHHYDLQYLVRAITASRVYELSSRTRSEKPADRRHFASMPLRRMTGEQLFDSLVQATGVREAAAPRGRRVPFDYESVQSAFQQKFSDTSVSRTEAETTILQALSLMNGKLIGDATDLKQSETLSAVAEAPFLNTPAKVEALYLSALSRRPAADESQQLIAYVESGGPSHDPPAALADVFWALLNCAEFVLAH